MVGMKKKRRVMEHRQLSFGPNNKCDAKIPLIIDVMDHAEGNTPSYQYCLVNQVCHFIACSLRKRKTKMQTQWPLAAANKLAVTGELKAMWTL